MLGSAEQPDSVLIVDRSIEAREVLRTLLERRGMRILETSEAREGLRLLCDERPRLVVLDSECLERADRDVEAALATATRQSDTALVLLGKLTKGCQADLADAVVPKPYHYGPLIRTIEDFVGQGIQDGIAVRDSGSRSGEAIRASH